MASSEFINLRLYNVLGADFDVHKNDIKNVTHYGLDEHGDWLYEVELSNGSKVIVCYEHYFREIGSGAPPKNIPKAAPVEYLLKLHDITKRVKSDTISIWSDSIASIEPLYADSANYASIIRLKNGSSIIVTHSTDQSTWPVRTYASHILPRGDVYSEILRLLNSGVLLAQEQALELIIKVASRVRL
jgi:hypothetical protein